MRKPFQKTKKLQVGREYPPDEEVKYMEEMIEKLELQLERMYSEGKTLRQAHPKMHGCVEAEFTIEPNLSQELKTGIFEEEKTFHALIRFSNASTQIKPDSKKDIRGMSIKLLDVPGEKLLDYGRNAKTQDFLLISHNTFISKNVREFHKTIRAITGGKMSLLKYFLNPFHIGVLRRTMQSLKPCKHMLQIPYYSTTPYQFGDETRAVKYFINPSNDRRFTYSETVNENYLRTNLVNTLSIEKQDAYFDFYVQFQTDPQTMPVENPTVLWNAPYVKLATIKIPAQVFDTEEQNAFGQNLSFSPWHCLPEHRPIGGINRARKRVYEALAQFRLQRNHHIPAEPSLSHLPTTIQNSMNEQIVRQLYANFSSKNMQGVMSLLHPDIVWIEPGAPDVPFGGTYTGTAGVQQMFEKEAVLEVTGFAPKSFFSNDNMVVVLGSDSAIVTTTQKAYSTDWTMVFTLAEGKITRVQVYMDTNAIAKAFEA